MGIEVLPAVAYVGSARLFEAHGFERVLRTTGRRGGKPHWPVRRGNLSHDPDTPERFARKSGIFRVILPGLS